MYNNVEMVGFKGRCEGKIGYEAIIESPSMARQKANDEYHSMISSPTFQTQLAF